MKILHITNEFSKKNFSISSLIIYFSNLFTNSKNEINILTSKIDFSLFKEKNIESLNEDGWFHIFFKKNMIKKKINSHDIIHVHGIWSPIQLFTIFYCNSINKTLFIHPHGMLLKEALSSTGIIKLLIKNVTLIFLSYFIKKCTSFISITNQESKAIKKYFKDSIYTEIPNPIPFKLQEQESTKKLKQFIYLGRIHPHKNLELLIESFKAAKLGNDWSLKIYGIKDDKNYYNKILDSIKDDNNINIFEPIFDNERQKIISNSWANILVSKSEVLSLSILESSYFGLPTINNKDIELSDYKDCVIPTSIDTESVKDRIIEVSKWTYDKRIQKENTIKSIFKNKFEKLNLYQLYLDLYQDLFAPAVRKKDIQDKNINLSNPFDKFLSNKNYKFILISAGYTFNLMFCSLFVVILVAFGKYALAAEIGIVSSIFISFTQIFSSNMRGIIISEQNINLANETFLFRLAMSLSTIFLVYFFIPNFQIVEKYLSISIASLILFQWLYEMTLSKKEIQNKYNFFILFSFYNIIFLGVVFFLLLFQKIHFIPHLVATYIIILTSYIANDILNIHHYFKKFKHILDLNLRTVAFTSSFSIIFSSLIWRLMIYNIFDKSVSGVFFACFSVGSFPGTLFNSVIGPTYIKKKIILGKYIKLLLLVMFFVILGIAGKSFLSLNWTLIDKNLIDNQFITFIISVSLLGSYFMCYAMYIRHRKIQTTTTERQILFKTDIVYGASITLFVPTLYYVGGIVATSFAFFLASFFAFLIYSRNNNTGE